MVFVIEPFAATDQVSEQTQDLNVVALNLGMNYHFANLKISPELLVTGINLVDLQYFPSVHHDTQCPAAVTAQLCCTVRRWL